MEGSGSVGDGMATVLPGGAAYGLTYNELTALGDGAHDVDDVVPPPPEEDEGGGKAEK